MKLGQDVLWLSEDDVRDLLTMKETISAVQAVFALHGQGQVQLPAKIYLDFEPYGGDLRAMPAYVRGDAPAAGVKIVNSNAKNPDIGLPAVTGIMVYVDPKTGMPLSVLGAGHLTGMRTGAAGGIAAKFLARPDSKIVGLVGCGKQAATQAQALEEFFSIEKAFVWGKTRAEAEQFCALSQKSLKMKLVVVDTVREACAADIIVTTTPVHTPVVKTEWVKPGTHVNAIGADAPGKQELETSLLNKSRVVVDEWVQASHAGEINVAVSAGQFSQSDVAAQLGEIITGKKKGRLSPTDITIFDSTGLAIQDVAMAQLLYNKALKLKKGQVLKLHG